MGARLLERFSLANKGFAEIESIWFRVRVYNDAAAKQLVAFKQFKPSSARCTRSFIKEVRDKLRTCPPGAGFAKAS